MINQVIPYGRQDIDEADIQAVVDALKGNFITTGPLVRKFEEKLTEYIGTPTIVVSSGTAALHAAYVGLGIMPGDEIITPPITFIATQATAAFLGAKIVFADIDIKTGLISVDSILEKVSERTKVVVVVDYAGQTIDINNLRKRLKNRNIYILEDAAHSLGTTFEGRPVGMYADVTTFSFYATKNITTAEGGAISTNSEKILSRAQVFARQGLVRDPQSFRNPPDGPWHQEVHEFGLNYRLPDILCALGISQLSKIEKFKSHRKMLVETYRSKLSTISGVTLLEKVRNCDPMWHLMPILVDENRRSEMYFHLRSKGFGVQVNYFPAHLHPVFAVKDGINCPNAENFYKSTLSLPLHSTMTAENVNQVVEHIFELGL